MIDHTRPRRYVVNYSTSMSSASLNERISARFAPPHLHALDQWEVVRHLGSGSSADVWLLKHASGRYRVACKISKTPERSEERRVGKECRSRWWEDAQERRR